MWMRMPGQTWADAGGVVRRHVGRDDGGDDAAIARPHAVALPPGDRRSERRHAPLGWSRSSASRYFFVWTVLGTIVFPLGVALVEMQMRLPALARSRLSGSVRPCCSPASCSSRRGRRVTSRSAAMRPAAVAHFAADAGTAWRHGLQLGAHCSRSCAGLTAVMLVLGVMDVRVMAVVTAAITAERLAPAGARVARAIGLIVVATGLVQLARAAGLG